MTSAVRPSLLVTVTVVVPLPSAFTVPSLDTEATLLSATKKRMKAPTTEQS
jgi:hypothetical protein